MNPLREAIQRTYERGAAFDSYTLWHITGNQADLDQAFTASLPLVRTAVHRYQRRKNVDRKEMVSIASCALYRALMDPASHVTGEAGLPRYLVGRMRSAILAAMRADRQYVYDFDYACVSPPAGNVPHHRDMEFKLFLEELPKVLRDYVHDHTRLSGAERHAGTRILAWVLRGHNIVPEFVSQHFQLDLETVRFLIDYVVVMVRKCLTEMKRVDGGIVEDWYDLYELYTPEIVAVNETKAAEQRGEFRS